jgi:tRNA pseudouridine32 synthase/23S rRNA pseudouridine746 synthase
MSESHNARIDVPELTADEIQARVLHRDGLMLVIDKPAGLPVHRGPKGGANLEASFDALRFGLPRPPVLAHRLDRDTSGCLVLGRHRKATASLGLLFKHGRISKTYWAVVEGGPVEDEGVIDMPLGRLNAERGWWQKPDPEGQTAVTRWKVLGRAFFSPPRAESRRAQLALRGRGWGCHRDKLPLSTPLPNPPPQEGREQLNSPGSRSNR